MRQEFGEGYLFDIFVCLRWVSLVFIGFGFGLFPLVYLVSLFGLGILMFDNLGRFVVCYFDVLILCCFWRFVNDFMVWFFWGVLILCCGLCFDFSVICLVIALAIWVVSVF